MIKAENTASNKFPYFIKKRFEQQFNILGFTL